MVTREEHLAWCKQRALEYANRGQLEEAWTSMLGDLNKHDQTRGHSAIELGTMLKFAGHLSTIRDMRQFIEGFN
jgi:hypothetical protein